VVRSGLRGFAILPFVRIANGFSFSRALIFVAAATLAVLPLCFSIAQAPQQPAAPVAAPPYPTIQQPAAPPPSLTIVVLDPAHGGTDPGARGAQGIRESDLLLDLTTQARRALEAQGFQVLQTRSGSENPSFDDRSSMANAQRGAVFVTLHIASTGIPGTARVYVSPDAPANTVGNLLSWDHAQFPFAPLSRKFGDAVQGQLAQRFKGSPANAQAASIRQLRTTAAPAIAVELSSVSVQDRAELDQMMPGVADAIARGVAAFRPSYVLASIGSSQP
jgi:N-acetylmuramoyl-L-alanine amidase